MTEEPEASVPLTARELRLLRQRLAWQPPGNGPPPAGTGYPAVDSALDAKLYAAQRALERSCPPPGGGDVIPPRLRGTVHPDTATPPPGLILPGSIVSAVTTEEATALADLAAGKTVLELGAYHGYSTVVLASVAKRVISVDWHLGDDMAGTGDSWAVFTGNLELYGVADRVEAVRDRFETALPKLAEAGWTGKFDGCFLDGHHSEESVSADVALVLPLIRPGGWIAFHDYGRSSETGHAGFGVTEVADKFGVAGRVGFMAWGFTPDDSAEAVSRP